MKINLAKAMFSSGRVNCYGFIYRFSNGKYGYQNDNDLGLDYDDIDYVASVKKVKCGKGWVYQVINERNCTPDDDGYGVSKKLALLFIKDCHSFRDPLTPQEKKAIERYRNS